MKFIVYTAIVLLLFSCNSSKKKIQRGEGNIYIEEPLQKIYTAQYERNTKVLLPYLKDENPIYRAAAALALGSVQDTLLVNSLSAMLADDNEKVRTNAVFALGQLQCQAAEKILMDALDTEQAYEIRAAIMEAIGKCGTQKGLQFITELNYSHDQPQLLSGQMWALTRFVTRNIISDKGTEKAIELISNDIPQEIRYIASIYFARYPNTLNKYALNLLSAYDSSKYLPTKLFLTTAFRRINTPQSFELLKRIVSTESDYRLKVNAIASLASFDYAQVKELIFKCLENSNTNISVRASEYFVANGQSDDAERYFELATKISNWRPRANMLTASLKYTVNKANISNEIIAKYKQSNNDYEKAYLLKALSGNVDNHAFIANEIFTTHTKIIASMGLEGLVEIRKSPLFEAACASNSKLNDTFADYFKKAIESGDAALVATAAEVLRTPEMKYNEYFKNIYFFKQALKKCKLPEQTETYAELLKTSNFMFGTHDSIPKPKFKPLDWATIVLIPENQKVRINTAKGKITIKLFVNDAPATVANFLTLIKSGFYQKSGFHRTVPNFLVQGGCIRGDGWGGADFVIPSELTPLRNVEGSVGMASAGKDTEATQWYITNSNTPHLDARYTIFGEVVEGLNVVHSLEVGDKFLGFEILE